jgi:hypothetical protein
MSQTSQTDIGRQAARVLHDLVEGATRPPMNRVTILAVALLSLGLSLSLAPTMGVPAALAALGLNVSSGFVWDFLSRCLRRGEKLPNLQDAIATIEAMSEEERCRLEGLADKLDLLPNLLRELFEQQRADLLDGFATMLRTWGDTLPTQELRDTLAELIRQTACLEAMREQLDGVSVQTARIEVLQADLSELRRLLDSLIAQQQVAEPASTINWRRRRRLGEALLAQVEGIISEELLSEVRDLSGDDSGL